MKHFFATLRLCLAFITASFSFVASAQESAPGAPCTIVIVGDSTVSNYSTNRPDRGWGMFIEEQFRPGTVKVVNLARPGRSTKTFIAEGRWKKALEEKPNYVLIQFGHNDSHAPEKPESTDAATTYREYLRRYVDDSRAINAVPILITPMVRRTFDADGHLTDDLQPYADAMKPAMELMISVMLHKTDDSPWTDEELSPIQNIEIRDVTPTNSVLGARITLSSGKQYVVDFKDVDGYKSC